MNHRLLVVEPDANIRPLLERIFQRAEMQPTTVSTLPDAIAALEQNEFCFALIDCVPAEACLVDDVAALRPDLPIGVTATIPKSLASLPPSVVKVFAKPYDIATLVTAAREHCHGARIHAVSAS